MAQTRVLLFLSDPHSGQTLHTAFTRLSCKVECVTTLNELQSRLSRQHPDLIVIDDSVSRDAAALPEIRDASKAPILILAEREGTARFVGAFNAVALLQRLADHTELLWNILDNIPVMVAVYDDAGRALFINGALARTTGWSADEAKRIEFLAALYPDPQVRQAARDFMQQATPGWQDFILTTRSGGTLDTSWANVRLTSGLRVGIGLDVRARKAAEQRLIELNQELDQALLRWRDAFREAERRRAAFERLAENSPDIISRFDRAKRYLYVNRAVESATGRLREEFIGRSHHEFGMPEASSLNWERQLQRAFDTGEVQIVEFLLEPREGEQYVFEGFLVPEYDLDGTVATVLSIARDVTERKRIEANLRESELRFRQLAENITEVFWLTAWPENRVIYVSPAFEPIWGLPVAKLYANPMAWSAAIVAEDRARIEEAFFHAVETGNFDVSFRIIRPNGEERWIHDRGFVVQDAGGKVYRLAGVAQDRTDEKRADEALRATNRQLGDTLSALRRAQARIIETEKDAALGTLAAGVANELSDPLMGVMGYVGHVRNHPGPDSVEMLTRAERELFRLRDAISKLVSFARPINEAAQEVTIPDLLSRTVTPLLPEFARNHITFEFRSEPDLPPVRAKAAHLEQVFRNLLINAQEAVMQVEERHITMRAWHCGETLCVEVADTGAGIPGPVRQHMFDPFFTSKSGTGFGLSVSRDIIEDLGGTLTFDTTEGKGTRFLVCLGPCPPHDSGTEC